MKDVELVRLDAAIEESLMKDPACFAAMMEKVEMSFAGEVVEPDDGRVWRWEMEVG